MINTRQDLEALPAAAKLDVLRSLWVASINADGARTDDAVFGFSSAELDVIFSGSPPVPVSTIVEERVVVKSLTRRQVRMGLLHHSLLDAVEAALPSNPAMRIYYEDSMIFWRNSPMIEAMAQQLGKDSSWLDAFFDTDWESGV